MGTLTQTNRKFLGRWTLLVEDAVSAKELTDLKKVFKGWVEDSRSYTKDYGETLDGRPRFDLQPGHRPHTALGVCNHRKKFQIFMRM